MMDYPRQFSPFGTPVRECTAGDAHPVECHLGIVGYAALLQVGYQVFGHEVEEPGPVEGMHLGIIPVCMG